MTHSFPTRRSPDLRLPGQLHPAGAVARPAAAAAGRALEAGHGNVCEADHDFARLRRSSAHGRPAGEVDPALRSRRHARAPESCGTSGAQRSEEHTSELQSLMRISYAVFCLKKTNN